MKLYAKCAHPNAGWDWDSKKAKELVEANDKDKIYEVDRAHIGRSSSVVHIGGITYNSVNFMYFIDVNNALVEYDIYRNPAQLPAIFMDYVQM